MQFLYMIGYNSHIYKQVAGFWYTYITQSLCRVNTMDGIYWVYTYFACTLDYHMSVYTKNISSQFTGCR